MMHLPQNIIIALTYYPRVMTYGHAHGQGHALGRAHARAAKNSDFVRVVGFCAVLAGTRTDILPTSVAFGFR